MTALDLFWKIIAVGSGCWLVLFVPIGIIWVVGRFNKRSLGDQLARFEATMPTAPVKEDKEGEDL